MDDYSISSLSESKNEWCARLVNTLTPAIIAGLKSIFEEAWNVCIESEEEDKYLMTFQTFLSRVPKWNPQMIEEERKRIEQESGCGYLEELITCVHVIQLKALTCVRVGHKQKKIDIDVPNADQFVHRVYTNVARKLYTNVYIFQKEIPPLEVQKHNRELELIIKECILNAVRDTMPVEKILRAYMDETEEQDVDIKEELLISEADKEEPKSEEKEDAVIDTAPMPDTTSIPSEENLSEKQIDAKEPEANIITKLQEEGTVAPTLANESLTFSNIDKAIDSKGVKTNIEAPKTAERLEQIETETAIKREQEKDEEENDEEDTLRIGDDISLELGDVNDMNQKIQVIPPLLDDVEVLDPL
mgnify:CR=1 FL=1